MKKWLVILLTMALAITAAACSCQQQPQTAVTPLTGTMAENVSKIMEKNPTEFMGAVIPVDLQDTSEENRWAVKNYTGLEATEKLTDVAVYESMTGSQAFSLVLARVANAADAETVARQMIENINPGKWICVRADQVMAAGYGDVVMFVMVDSQLGKTAQSYVDAFESICGGKANFTI